MDRRTLADPCAAAARPDRTRRWLVAGLLAGTAEIALANAPTASLRPRPKPGAAPVFAEAPDLPATRPKRRPEPERPPDAADLIAEARLGVRADVAYVVADAETGEVLEQLGSDLALPPASVNKAITALYALDALGPQHRFRTRLLATGPLEGGKLNGDLILAGSGDPTLDTNGLADLAAQAKASGLREMTGRFLLYDAALPTVRAIDPGQPDQVGYNPGVSGLNLNFNRVHFEWRRAGSSWTTTMDARSDIHRPGVGMARMSVVQRTTPIYTYTAGDGVDRWTVASGALGSGGTRWLPVRHPAEYCADVFMTFARSHGIVLPRPERSVAVPSGVALGEVVSADLRTILRGMLRFSTNLTAEAVGLAATAARTLAPAKDLATSASEMSRWLQEQIGSAEPRLVDHSGLGDQSRVSAADMVRTLVRLADPAALQPILRNLALRDARFRVMDAPSATVEAKTGTLNFVSALSGFATARGSGRRLAFAIFTADVERRATIPREDREGPAGAAPWARRSRILQNRLIDRWARLYGDPRFQAPAAQVGPAQGAGRVPGAGPAAAASAASQIVR